MVNRKPQPAPPRLTLPTPEPAVIVDAEQLAGDSDLFCVRADGLEASQLLWDGRRRLDSSVLARLRITEWRLRGSMLVESVLDGLDVQSLAAARSGWRFVAVRGSRFGAGEFYDSTWHSVEFRDCRIGYLNLRGARLSDVAFTNCVIDEVDLLRAEATRLSFSGTRIGRLEVTDATLSDVDLREAALGEVIGLDGLRGATISNAQLLDLAPVLAARIGVLID